MPLNVISAPAGYGKSTVVSHWLETCRYPSAWLSLDETDSDLRVFVSYVVAAVQTVSSTACQETLTQLRADELPSAERLAGFLCNDLDAIGKPFILVLDDYHRIREPSVHELINRLLEHPPRDLHLTIMSRREPPLSLEKLMEGDLLTCVSSQCIQGEVDVLRGYQEYTKSEGGLAVERAEQALSRLPSDCLSQRGFAVVLLAIGHQMVGDLVQARRVGYDALAHDPVPSRSSYDARLLFSLCFVDWMAADLLSLKRTAAHCVEMSDKFGLQESSAIGRYFVGIAQYQQHELAAAEASFVPVFTGPMMSNMEYFAQIAFALASVYEARGQSGKAWATAEFIEDHMLEIRNLDQLVLAQAFQAELALRQGRLAEAIKWAAQFDPEPFVPMHRFYSPQMTFAKVLFAQGSQQSHDQADSLLARLEAYLAKIHNTRFLIEVLALQALLRDAQGKESAALAILGRAVTLAQPGGSVRLFADLDPQIASLLDRLSLDEEGRRYVQRILSACRDDEQEKRGQVSRAGGLPEQAVLIEGSAGSPPLLSPLTNREREILGMLAIRLSNKEIAGQLCIAPATVKRHAESIYSKLGVGGRRAAVAKAVGLGILDAD